MAIRYEKLNKIILAFLEFFFCFFLEKIYCLKEFLLLVLKCLKFNCFILQSQVFNVIEVPHSDPLISDDSSSEN